MAERRMFTKKITDADEFISLPSSTQALYLHLCMGADDDGFTNQIQIAMLKAHASIDDVKVLLTKRFILQFESGVIVIKHWRMANALRKDRYTETAYQEELKRLKIKENGSYTLEEEDAWLPNGCQMVATGKDSIDKGSIGKDRLGKDRLGKDNLNSIRDTVRPTETVERIIEKWNTLSDLGIKPISKLGEGTQRRTWLLARLKTYTEDDFYKAIENVRHSLFLQGHNKNGWTITFDWFVRPNNFPKVLEGNYNDTKPEPPKYESKPEEVHKQTPEEIAAAKAWWDSLEDDGDV